MQRLAKISCLITCQVLLLFAGVLIVDSDPRGATVVINDKPTKHKTPDTLILVEDMATVTVQYKEYQFQRRTVLLSKEDTLNLSFTHMQIMDTISIFGDKQYGILNLPAPPLPIPYMIDEYIENGHNKILLPPGKHRIYWDGGIPYVPLDTTIEVILGEITSPSLTFKQRFGTLFITTIPDTALIYLNNELIGVGQSRRPVEAGNHIVEVKATGFITDSTSLLVLPGKTRSEEITLFTSGDRDGDGFLDSLDLCPDEYGIYSGCPSIDRRNEIKKITGFLGKHFIYQPFTVQLGILSYQRRVAYSRRAREFFNFYNDGAPLFNNYRGFQGLNKLWIGASFFIASAEVGQSFYGLHYDKYTQDENNYSYRVDFDGGDSLFLAGHEYESRHPELHITSGSFQGGVRFHFKRIGLSLLTGYHVETITYQDLLKIDPVTDDYEFITISEKNNCWITTLNATIAFSDQPLIPRLYFEADFTSSKANVTGWSNAEIGIFLPFYKMK